MFYLCGICNIYLCPLCSSIHNKLHKLIEFDNKNYICNKHNEQFISYCETKYNLCLQCELEHNNNHKIISYKSIYPNIDIIKNKMKDLGNIFNNDINKIIDILSNIKNNINKYYEINMKIILKLTKEIIKYYKILMILMIMKILLMIWIILLKKIII